MRRSTTVCTLGTGILTLLLAFSGCDKDPQDPMAPVRALVAEGKIDDARALLEGMRDEQGLTPTIALGLGALLEREGEFSRAVSLYRKVADSAEADTEGVGRLNARLGEVFLALDQTTSALDRLRLAREAGIGDELISMPLAVAHGRLKEFAKAQAELDRAEAAGAQREVVLYNRALILGTEGKNQEAYELLEEALAMDTDDVSVLRELARLELVIAPADTAAASRAMDYINEAITINEAAGNLDWRSYEVLGDAFIVLGDWQAASQMFLKAKEIGLEPDERLDDKYYRCQVELRNLHGETEAPK